jgi:hypothetical protein
MSDSKSEEVTDFFAAERPEDWVKPRVDFHAGAAVLAVGLLVIWFSFDMPTFYDKGGERYHAPGIVPGFYGVIVALLGLALTLRAVFRGALRPDGGLPGKAEPEGTSNARLFVVAGLGIAFIVGLIGVVPFWLATAIFVAAFIVIFEWRAAKNRLRMLLSAVAIGVGTGIAVTWLFQDIFLVRLP